MTPRFASALLLASLLFVAACDSTSSRDDVTGYWVGTVAFEVDTTLTDQNLRIWADYEATFAFDLDYENNLVNGTVLDDFEGTFIVQEAGGTPDTLVMDGPLFGLFATYGTYLEPELEVDVPGGPYQENLWTFEVTGRKAVSESYITQQWPVVLRGGTVYSFSIRSDEPFEMKREDRPEAAATASASVLSVAQPDRFGPLLRRHRSEQ